MKASDGFVFGLVAMYAASFVVFGFVISPPGEVLDGLIEIHLVRDALITDYVGVGGLGAAFANAGLLPLLACVLYRLTSAPMSGQSIACLFLLLGFGLFGMNLVNVPPIVLGVFLYAMYRRVPFRNLVNLAIFSCGLSPIFSEILFSSSLPLAVSAPLAAMTAVGLGFIMPPVAEQVFRAHNGFILYNVGFAAGIVGTLTVALYASYGIVPEPVMIWTSGNNETLGVFLVPMFVSMLVIGVILDRRALAGLLTILKSPGQAPADFVAAAGLGPTLVNMGLCGLIGVGSVLLVGGDLNGPTIGGILVIVGFAACGKHLANIVPIMAGVYVGSLAKIWSATDEAIVLAMLFGTTLAPIAGRFGWHWGLVAGFVHSSAALSVGAASAGLNLFNNGFAAGFVATVLTPVIVAITSPRRTTSDPPHVSRS